MELEMKIQHFYDERTHSITYLVYDPGTQAAVIIDPVLDFDPNRARTFTESAETAAAYIDEHRLQLAYALDTHPHADHLTALPYFKNRYGCQTVVGKKICQVQETWRDIYNLGDNFPVDGRQFDLLVDDGDRLDVGGLRIDVIETHGHTPACVSCKVGDAVFVGDLLFQPDSGTGRCDFPGGSAAQEYDSIQKLYRLPEETRLFTLHDYQPGGRELRFESTVGEQKRSNVHLSGGVSKEEFVALHERLEKGKALPGLLFPALQINIAGGALPGPESNGVSYLKFPLNRF
jgi:glyoxylase-like metal-dependent hydrolase (beta-lactamase superfamily II)